ncbi:MAG: glycerol-3-phosphate dehydrogenase/oxidase [Acidimicrobiales bacterium]
MESGELDVLVVGGGIVGAGVALDAVTRGLSVGLVEARDYGSGTSSRSSKLVHGGLRYIQRLDLALVSEALSERGLLLGRLAPHLVRPVPFLFPLTRRGWERCYVGAGVLLYDLLARAGSGASLPAHRHRSRAAALRRFPSLRPDALCGAVEYHDAQVDDARYVVTLVRTAAAHGAAVANRAKVVGLLREGRRVTGAVVHDLDRPGRELRLRARQVISAAGVWSDEVVALGRDPGTGGEGLGEGVRLRASKGVHLVLEGDRLRGHCALISRTDESILLVIPWAGRWVVGTTDTDWGLGKAHPAASRRDVEYLLSRLSTLVSSPPSVEDVVGVYAGLRPLLAKEGRSTSSLSRRYAVLAPAPGLIAVTGGKLTTYRLMARDAVDRAARALGGPVARSCTREVPLLGAEGSPAARGSTAAASRAGLSAAQLERLVDRYGSLSREVLELASGMPGLLEPLPGGAGHLGAEVLYAVTHEGARHLEDVLTRRTRVSILAADRGLSAAGPAAALMAGALGWEPQRVASEVDHYRARVAAERAAQEQADDRSAEVARLGAGEIVPS